jgi:hypothetical protein
MPLYMDRHYVEGATRSAVAHAHQLDLAVQEKYKALKRFLGLGSSLGHRLARSPQRSNWDHAKRTNTKETQTK